MTTEARRSGRAKKKTKHTSADPLPPPPRTGRRRHVSPRPLRCSCARGAAGGYSTAYGVPGPRAPRSGPKRTRAGAMRTAHCGRAVHSCGSVSSHRGAVAACALCARGRAAPQGRGPWRRCPESQRGARSGDWPFDRAAPCTSWCSRGASFPGLVAGGSFPRRASHGLGLCAVQRRVM